MVYTYILVDVYFIYLVSVTAGGSMSPDGT